MCGCAAFSARGVILTSYNNNLGSATSLPTVARATRVCLKRPQRIICSFLLLNFRLFRVTTNIE
jgi:hypothetical protein